MMEKSSLTPEKSSANAVLNIQREVVAGRLRLAVEQFEELEDAEHVR